MAQSMLGGLESASQVVAPSMGIHPRNKKPVDLLKSVPCEEGDCAKCPGAGAEGFWNFADEKKRAMMLKLAPNGVRCPCGCHD